jgi:hypothetical protein
MSCTLVGDVPHVIRIETLRTAPLNVGSIHAVLRRLSPVGRLP